MELKAETNKRTIEDEIDLLGIFVKLINGWKTILITTVIFLIAGILIALYKSYTSKKEYMAEVKLLIEPLKTTGNSFISPPLSLGFFVNNFIEEGNEVLIPDLYPEVITSELFLNDFICHKIQNIKDTGTLTISQFINKYQGSDGGNIETLRSSINAELDENKMLILSVKMQDPLAAIQLNDTLVNFFDNYLRSMQIKKINNKIKIFSDRQIILKNRMIQLGKELTNLSDQQGKMSSDKFKNFEDNLRTDYKLAVDIYIFQSLQLEQAKFKLIEIEQTKSVQKFDSQKVSEVPLKPRPNVIITALFALGLLTGGGIVYGKDYFKRKFKHIN